MIKTVYLSLLFLALITGACSKQTPGGQNNLKEASMSNPYPFEVIDDHGQFTIMAALESNDLYSKYYPLFEKYGYVGNGPCWEGHITQILEKKDQELLNHLNFDPEAGGFYVYADSKAAQARFINILSPIFADLKQLEEYVKSADRDRVDD